MGGPGTTGPPAGDDLAVDAILGAIVTSAHTHRNVTHQPE